MQENNKYKNLLIDIDDIVYNITSGLNAALAIHVAMFEGKNSAKSFKDGLFFVLMQTDEYINKLRCAVDQELNCSAAPQQGSADNRSLTRP